MNTFGGNQIKPMIFCFDALNPKCHTPGTHEFKELITGTTTTAYVASGKTLAIDSTLGSPHLRFVPGATTRNVYIPFTVATNPTQNGVRVPTGTLGTWSVWIYFQDQGNIDHPFFGWETGNGWDGANGFVFGTGWGTDGVRPGVAGQSYGSVGGMANTTWINFTMTFDGNATNGLKVYKNGVLQYQGTPSNKLITGVNNNPLMIGATNTRGGNFGGYMDLIQMWDVPLTADEVVGLYNQNKGRF